MGRREDRAEMQSTWSTYTPRVPGTPFRKKDIEDAETRLEAEEAEMFRRWSQATSMVAPRLPDMLPSDALMRGILGRLGR